MKAELELWVCVAANGDYETGTSEQVARERFEETIGPLNETDGFRLYQINLSAPLPEPVGLTGDVPETEGAPTLTVA